jgi:pyruvate ferredoxin oxidoreductase beta subunit
MEKTVEMGVLAVETGAWALYEYENGKVTFNGKSKLILEGKIQRKPIEDWINTKEDLGIFLSQKKMRRKLS